MNLAGREQDELEAFEACIAKHFPAPIPPTGTAPSAVRQREILLGVMLEFFKSGSKWQRAYSSGLYVDRKLLLEISLGDPSLGGSSQQLIKSWAAMRELRQILADT